MRTRLVHAGRPGRTLPALLNRIWELGVRQVLREEETPGHFPNQQGSTRLMTLRPLHLLTETKTFAPCLACAITTLQVGDRHSSPRLNHRQVGQGECLDLGQHNSLPDIIYIIGGLAKDAWKPTAAKLALSWHPMVDVPIEFRRAGYPPGDHTSDNFAGSFARDARCHCESVTHSCKSLSSCSGAVGSESWTIPPGFASRVNHHGDVIRRLSDQKCPELHPLNSRRTRSTV